MVEVALKIKNVSYEYVEEDLLNKSQELLRINPVYKKAPVLVYNGRPIVESFVILQYIDEAWMNSPVLLPEDQYEWAKVRFWGDFIEKQIFDKIVEIVKGNNPEKKIAEITHSLKLMEENMKDIIPKEPPCALNMGLVDVVICPLLNSIRGWEAVFNLKILDPEATPFLLSWLTCLSEVPAVKGTAPPHEKLVEYLLLVRSVYDSRSTA